MFFVFDLVCVAQEGEMAEDAAFLVRVGEKKVTFMQGSKESFEEDTSSFEGINIKVIDNQIDMKAKNIKIKGLMMGSISHEMVIKKGLKAQNLIDGSVLVKLTCSEFDNLKIKVLK